MFVGALLDLGLPQERLLAELKKIPLGDYEFKRTLAVRGHLAGTRVEILIPAKQPHRKLGDIQGLVAASGLSSAVQERVMKVFGRLAEAEGKLHNMPPEQVHFHEVGAVDSILDIVGTCVGLELLEDFVSHMFAGECGQRKRTGCARFAAGAGARSARTAQKRAHLFVGRRRGTRDSNRCGAYHYFGRGLRTCPGDESGAHRIRCRSARDSRTT